MRYVGARANDVAQDVGVLSAIQTEQHGVERLGAFVDWGNSTARRDRHEPEPMQHSGRVSLESLEFTDVRQRRIWNSAWHVF